MDSHWTRAPRNISSSHIFLATLFNTIKFDLFRAQLMQEIKKQKWSTAPRYLATIQYQYAQSFSGNTRKQTDCWKKKKRSHVARPCKCSGSSQSASPAFSCAFCLFRLQYSRVQKLGDYRHATKAEAKKSYIKKETLTPPRNKTQLHTSMHPLFMFLLGE